MKSRSSETEWKRIIARISKEHPTLRPLAAVAAKDELLRETFPYLSHQWLGFSRTPKYPFTDGLPFVSAKPDGTFEVQMRMGEVLGRGTIEQALAIIKAICACHAGTEK